MKKIIGLIAASAVLGAMLLPATVAHAANAGAAVGGCQVNLPSWPGSGGAPPCSTGDLPTDGHAVGAFLPGGPVCVPLCDFTASVDNYGETCTAVGPVSPPPLLGTASGTLTVSTATGPVPGSQSAGYSWTRVGLVAVIVFSGAGPTRGAGVAAFLPDPRGGLPTCAQPGPLKAHVVGLALAEQGV